MKKIILLLFVALSAMWCKTYAVTDQLPMARFVDSMKESPYKSDMTGIDYQLRGEYESGAVMFEMTSRFYGGVTATSSDMTLEKVTFAWNPDWMMNKQDDVQVVVYGSDEPYASVADLYDADKRGTEIGRAAYPATEIVVAGGYKNVGICFEAPSRSYCAELTAIQFVWQGAAAEPMEPLTLVTDKGVSVCGEYTVVLAEPTKVLVSSETPDVNISWTYGDRSGSAVGTAEITIDAAGTLQVTATKDGYLKRELSQSFKLSSPLTSIADVWEAYPVPGNGTVLTDEMFEVRFDMTVIFAANVGTDAQVIATDGTNYTRLYMRETQIDLAPGDVIAKGWMSSFRRDAGWKDFLPLVELKAASHDGVLPEPIAVGNEDALKELDPGTLVVVRKVTIEVPTSSEVYRLDEAVKQIKTLDSPVVLVNTFGLASQQPGVYDIYGVVDFYGYTRSNGPAVGPTDGDYATRKWRVAPTRWEVWQPTAPRPRFELATGAEVDSGEPIVITCQDAEATIMYRFDEEEYVVYNPENKPVMPARDVTVSAYAVKEGNRDSAVRTVSLKYSGKAGIGSISADAAGEARYYDLQGRPVAKPATGLYIKVAGGKASKVAL